MHITYTVITACQKINDYIPSLLQILVMWRSCATVVNAHCRSMKYIHIQK